jgi:LasA protease
MAAGQTWGLTGGPHNWAGLGFEGPYNSIDLANGDRVVRAARGGTVHFDNCWDAAQQRSKGYVRIDHGDLYSTVYYHVVSISVTEGQVVQAGQAIANQGDSIECSPPGTQRPAVHVHFSLYYTVRGL